MKTTTNKLSFHLISHTHWDREWYLPFETFRVELINLIDDLLLILSKDKKFIFHLDGYTKLLDDYLEIKPHNRDLIKQYIKEGNILTGPWYIQADEYLASGEALIRNLLIGTKEANNYGKCMLVGYLPDQFGHIAQMPQVLKGFGIESAVFARGIQDGIAEHCWESISGDQILGIALTHWYGNCERLPLDKNEINQYLDEIYNKQGKTTKSNQLLLMNGCDHLFAQKNSNQNLENNNWLFKQTSLPTAINNISNSIVLKDLPKRIGELRDDNDMFILSSTHSSRVHLKLANHAIQNKIEKTIEPLASFLHLTQKIQYPYELINHAWKLLIQNHAHDSICGCSIDEVHREMEVRNEKVNQLIDQIKNNLLGEFIGLHDRTLKYINLINLSNLTRDESIEVTISIPLGAKATDPGAEGKIEEDPITSFNILDNNQKINFIVLKNDVKQRMQFSKDSVPLLQATQEIKVLLQAKLDPFSVKSLVLETKGNNLQAMKSNKPQCLNSNFIYENDFFELIINPNGTINIKDKESNKHFQNLHIYSLEEDNGDLYRFIPNEANSDGKLIDLCWGINVLEEDDLRTVFHLESKYFPGANIHTTISCYKNTRRIDFNSEINNTNTNQRLRLHFPTNISDNEILADTQFGVIKRKRPSTFRNSAYVQPIHNFLDHANNEHGLAFFGNGLSEYELSEDGNSFAITLIRSIGKLSIVKSHSFIETPEAQCNKKIQISYSIYPHNGKLDIENLFYEASMLSTPITYFQSETDCTSTTLIQTNNKVQISSLKRAENKENMYILRVYNSQDILLKNINLKLNFKFNKAYLLNLKEDLLAEIKNTKNSFYLISDTKIEYSIKPFEILTFGFEI